MSISVSSQANIFLYAVLGGMLVAFIYDLFRIKRRAVKTSTIITGIEDFCYWILVALVMFAMVYYSNEGELRGFIFIGSIIGVILYILLLSRLVISSSLFIIRIVVKICKTVWLVITYPFMLLFRILAVPGRFLAKLFKRAARATKRAGKDRARKALIYGKRLKNLGKKI